MSDLVINVRQIGSYPPEPGASAGDLVLLQEGGVGGPYYSTTPLGLLAPLENASLAVGTTPPPSDRPGQIFTLNVQFLPGGAIGWNAYLDQNGVWNTWLSSLGATEGWRPDIGWVWEIAVSQGANQPATFNTYMELTNAGALRLFQGTLTVARDPASALEVATMGWVGANTVASFNGRTGQVTLWPADIYGALGICDDLIATQGWVCNTINTILTANPFVFSFNGRDGAVTLLADDITLACTAPLATPQTLTPPPLDRSFRIPNTAWVSDYLYGPYWTDVNNAITQAIAGNPPPGGFAPINSPNFTGTPTAPPPPNADNSSRIPTTNWVRILLSTYAPLTSPSFSGIPAAPTANPGTATAQIATTAFVMAAIVGAVTGVVSFNTRTGAVVFTAADLNDVGGALLASPNFTGTPTVPMPAASNSSNQIASTAWVLDEISAISSGVISWNGQSGIVVMQSTDITDAGGALIASPAFSGTPTAPTPSPGTSNTQIATTAFVGAALVNTVSSFNGRNGPVTLNANDVTAAGGLANPSAALTGTPTAPTAAPGNSSTQIATTAFVAQAIGGLSGYLPLSGGTLTGPLVLPGNASAPLQAVPLQQLTSVTAGYLPLSGGTLVGTLNINPGQLHVAGSMFLPLATSVTWNIDNSGNYLAAGPAATITLGTTGLAISVANSGSVGATPSYFLPVLIAPQQVTISANALVQVPNGSSAGLTAIAPAGTNAMVFTTVTGMRTWYHGTSSASPGNFVIVDATASAIRFYIDNNGEVFCNGQTFLAGLTIANAWQLAPQTATTGQLSFVYGGVAVCFFATNGAIYGSSFQNTSDPKTKIELGPYGDGLAAICALEPITFRYNGRGQTPKDDDSVIRVGLDASEVERVIPLAVSHREDLLEPTAPSTSDILSIDNGPLVMALINAVKELTARVSTLENAA